MPHRLSENPESAGGVTLDDVLSSLLSTIRLSGSLQFCFMPSGSWQTDATPALSALASSRGSGVIPFHIVAEGTCWLRFGDDQTTLEAGDVVLFPFGSGHQLGSGRDGRLVTPTRDLPPKPWREVPVLRYGDDIAGVRMLCGYLQCEALGFSPFSRSLPEFVHVRTRANDGPGWLDATVRQMIAEVDRPRAGSVSMVPRLTEIIFIEVLRHQIVTSAPRAVGWLAALADPPLSRCLSIIHEDPRRDWTLEALADAARISRSVFAERFRAVLDISPIQYVREWRLYLASVALSTTRQTIADIAFNAGYASEAAFNRAFARAYGAPPATWRASAQS
jgi:AraC-like DNA-binding protein